MNRISLFLSACFCFLFLSLSAQKDTDKYWVYFNDKPSIGKTEAAKILSERAIQRRERQGISLDWTDYPLNENYLQTIADLNLPILQRSKWMNAISMRLKQNEVTQVASLPFVRTVRPISKVEVIYDDVVSESRFGYNSGFTHNQLDMIGLDKMHQNGFNGKGVLISIMDNGFKNADLNPGLQHLFATNRIVATYDFVNHEKNVFNEGDHGQYVLSILAGWIENGVDPRFWFYGSAHGASFILCQTEDNTQEVHQEEDNWLAAMEFADSIGADIFSTSLGYRYFDNGDDYGYAGLDGNTTIITKAADLAAKKGILVVNAAGNEGRNGDYTKAKLLAPADGDSVMAVGAVDSSRIITAFSSLGPSYDGRIKPDIAAMGGGTSYLQNTGLLAIGSGTSFSCPVASGMAACILQSAPETPNMVLFDAIIKSADRYANPDTIYGYGIPYAPKAYEILNGKALAGVLSEQILAETGIGVFPNPAVTDFKLVIDNDELPWEGSLELIDMNGKLVWQQQLKVAPFYNVWQFNRSTDFPQLSAGRYGLRVRNVAGSVVHAEKITLLNQR